MKRISFAVFIVLLSVSFLSTSLQAKNEVIGMVATINIQTPHPYPIGDENRPVVWSCRLSHPGATFIKIHFINFYINSPYGWDNFNHDYLAILDKEGNLIARYTGGGPLEMGDFWAIDIPGDVAVLEIHADAEGEKIRYGFDIDEYIHGFAKPKPLEPLITCNTRDKYHPNLPGDHPTDDIQCQREDPNVLKASKATARLILRYESGANFLCTGSCVKLAGIEGSGKNLILTAKHCVVDKPDHGKLTSITAEFNYLYAPPCLPNPYTGTTVPVPLEARDWCAPDSTHDWGMIWLDDAPCSDVNFGCLTPSTDDPSEGESVFIAQHPDGRRQEYDKDIVVGPGEFPCEFDHNVNTEGGSSGSSVCNTGGEVVGVHVGSYRDPMTGEVICPNRAVHMTWITNWIKEHPDSANATRIELVTFEAIGNYSYVEITWTTETEIDNAGFNIHRSEMEEGEYIRVTEELIQAMGSTVEGASYSYIDHDVIADNTYYYLLESVDLDGNSTMEGPIAVTLGMTEVAEGPSHLVPDAFGLAQNYPNPFNVVTDIGYQIPDISFVTLKVYNILGQEILTLINDVKEGGYYTIQWNGTDSVGQDVPSGVYLYRITAGDWSDTKRLVLLK